MQLNTYGKSNRVLHRLPPKTLLVMKLVAALIFITALQASAKSYAQKINLERHNATLGEVLNDIHEQTGYLFLYDSRALKGVKGIDVSVKNATLQQALDQCIAKYSLGYLVENKTILVFPKEDAHDFLKPARVVEGTVTDNNGKALSGVTVRIKNSNIGTITDQNGRFHIEVADDNTVLQFSYLGFEMQEQVVGNLSNLNVKLVASSNSLDQLVVVGYGTQKKSDLTGSISSLSAEDLKKVDVLSPDAALQGRISGVAVTQTSGQPGASNRIRIRGGNSISAGNEPLYVIDGFPVYNDNGATSTSAGRSPSLNALAMINPEDIESIEVLKDASATAIYGSRGANGVVIITTKRGKAGVNNISFETSLSMQKVRRIIPMLNAKEYASFENEIFLYQRDVLGQSSKVPAYTDAQIDSLGEGTNWQDALFRNAPMQNYHLSFTGGNDKMKYAITGGYTDQQGIILNSDYKRYSILLNLDRDVSSRIKIGNSSILSRTTSNLAFTGAAASIQGSNTGVVGVAIHMNPITPVRDASGQYTFQDQNIGEVPGAENRSVPFYNPVALAELSTNKSESFRALNNVFAEIKILDNLTFRTSLGVDFITTKQKSYIPSSVRFAATVGGTARLGQVQSFSWLNENTLNYQFVKGDHSLNLLAGYTAQSLKTEGFGISDQGFISDILAENNIGTGNRTPALQRPSTSAWGLLSYLARANYSYKDLYLLTATARYDGSSRFGKNNKWGFFPSMAFAWKLINEPFVKDIGVFSQLKLRTSYGLTGNTEIGEYQSLAHLGSGIYTINGQSASAFSLASIANPDLKWETTAQLDIGLDIGFLHDRIGVTADYYQKKTKDLLLNVQIPSTSGFTSSLQNVGGVTNTGFELNVSGTVIDKKDLRWDVAINVATNKNKVTNLGDEEQRLIYSNWNVLKGAPASVLQVGQPIGNFIGWKTNGWFLTDEEAAQAPNQTAADENPLQLGGNIRYVDINHDGVVDSKDRTIIGNALPKWTGGFSTNLAYKGFQLSTTWAFSLGNDVMNFNKLENYFGIGRYNAAKAFNHRWSYANTLEENKKATAPTVLDSRNLFSMIDFWVEDASYLRMRNVTLSYDIPVKKNNVIRQVQVYISGQNLLTFTKYTGYDPEVNLGGQDNLLLGYDYGMYPSAKTYTIGLRCNF
jgi:TonB-linked SusC/RagA family outer membrane protein